MAFIVLSSLAPQRAHPQRLKQDLVNSLDTALSMQRQMVQMTDAQVEAQFGVPTSAVSIFRTNVDNIVTALEVASVTNIISSLGFDA